MGSSLVTMHKLTAVLLFCVLNQISARCLLGVCTDKCEDNAPPAGTCAILFDEPKCNEDQFSVPINQGLTIRAVPVTGSMKEDAESLAVRRGCTLEVFNDDRCTGESFVFTAKNDRDLFVKDIEDDDDDEFEDEGFDIVDTDDLDDFEESIQCVKCTCGGKGFTGLKKRYNGSFGSSIISGLKSLSALGPPPKANFDAAQKTLGDLSLCGDSYTNYCDTRAFFLTPVKNKTKNKVDIRSVCKIL